MKDLKEVVVFTTHLILSGETAIRTDGEVNFKDIPLLQKPLLTLLPAIGDIKNVKEDFYSLTEESRNELKQEVKRIAKEDYDAELLVSDDYLADIISFSLTMVQMFVSTREQSK